MTIGFSDVLDRVLEAGTGVYNKISERNIVEQQRRAEEAKERAEALRLEQLNQVRAYGFGDDYSLSVGGYNLPNWVLPSLLVLGGLYLYKNLK